MFPSLKDQEHENELGEIGHVIFDILERLGGHRFQQTAGDKDLDRR